MNINIASIQQVQQTTHAQYVGEQPRRTLSALHALNYIVVVNSVVEGKYERPRGF